MAVCGNGKLHLHLKLLMFLNGAVCTAVGVCLCVFPLNGH